MIHSIYKIQNIITGKVYIGYTSNFEQRKTQHIKNSEKQTKINSKLYNSIRKYGVGNFSFDIIYQSKEKHHTKDTMEAYFIIEYDSLKNGYNMTKGGDGFDSETNSYYAKKNWGNSEYRERIVASMTSAQNDPELKKFHSEHTKSMWTKEEYREKIKLGVSEFWDNEENRKIQSERLKTIFSQEDQRKIRSENQKKCWDDPEYRKNQSLKQSEKWDDPTTKSFQLKGKYIITNPNGEIENVIGLKKYCRENGLNSKAMFDLSNGKREKYKGYRVKRVENFIE